MIGIDVTGRLAIVSGSSVGIGLGCAKTLARAGTNIVLVARDGDALDAAAKQIRTFGAPGEVRSVVADLATDEGCSLLVEAAPRCDILINNLGVYSSATTCLAFVGIRAGDG